ncbi:MAG TPA: hypothetical protein VFX49_02345 [Chloroflexota bacterium]|nr:hypothetical protein [Chloroflexota bacterium]
MSESRLPSQGPDLLADAPAPGEIKDLGIAGENLFAESLDPGIAPSDVTPGMAVVAADDEPVGEVKSIRPNCVVVSRTGAGDLYVPFTSMLEARDGRAVVNTLSTQVNRLGWDTPPATRRAA